MTKEIKSERYSPHCLAFCECGWTSGANGEEERKRQRLELFKHMRRENHKHGRIETGLVSHYSLIINT